MAKRVNAQKSRIQMDSAFLYFSCVGDADNCRSSSHTRAQPKNTNTIVDIAKGVLPAHPWDQDLCRQVHRDRVRAFRDYPYALCEEASLEVFSVGAKDCPTMIHPPPHQLQCPPSLQYLTIADWTAGLSADLSADQLAAY